MAKEKYVLDGYRFGSKEEFQRAKKEKETIMYITANTNMASGKEMYQVYEKAVSKKSFQTVFGMKFLEELRKRLIESKIVTEDMLEPIPTGKAVENPKGKETLSEKAIERKLQKYQEECERAKAGSVIKNFLIGVLIVIIIAMIVITYKSQYSVFTYFTDYKENMREELIDEYENWEKQLQKKEAKLEKQKKELQQQEKTQKNNK